MKALSIRQPWAWAILRAGKDVENRDWRSSFRGRVLIHASRGCTQHEYRDACHFMPGAPDVPELVRLHRGAIVGAVTIVDCVERSSSPWFVGRFGFVLENPVAFRTPVPCAGALGFFNVPADIERQLTRWLPKE